MDEEFLNGVLTGAEPYVTTVTVSRRQPFLDLDVISDARLTGPNPDEFVRRFRDLRRPFNQGRASHLLVSCGEMSSPAGNADYGDFWLPTLSRLRALAPAVFAVPGNSEATAPTRADGFYGRFAAGLVGNATMPERPQDFPLTRVIRVCLREDPVPAHALAYVAVIGFDSNEAAYNHPLIDDHGQLSAAQFDVSRRLVQVLSRNVALNVPLYVLAVTHHNLLPSESRALAASAEVDRFNQRANELECQSRCEGASLSNLCITNNMLVESSSGSTTNSSAFLKHCRSIRTSLIIHADMRSPEVTTMSSVSLLSGESPTEITVMACPPFDSASRMSGMARVRVNVWKGEVEIAFRYDVESEGRGGPIQIVRPLVSASRVTPAERRLYDTVHKLLDHAAVQPDADVAGIASFRTYVDEMWAESGYVALCFADGTLPDLPVTRRTVYNLLLLLRERDDVYEMLLSHHTALRASDIGYWHTLLLPAFQNARNLLEHLRDDVLRQVVDQAEDLEKADQVRAFEAAVGRILATSESEGDLWDDQLREVASVHKRKISPTTGCVTDYEYHLVTLLPLIRQVEDGGQRPDADGRDPSPEEQKREDYNTIIAWLSELPSVRRKAEHSQARVVPMDALRGNGGGLRWSPPAEFPDEFGSVPSEVARRLPPGAIWFPLPDSRDESAEPPWRHCPAIVSRNADVMKWVDGEIEARRRPNGGVPPPELVMGKLDQGSTSIEVVDTYSFEAGGDYLPTPDLPSGSTVDAISRVTFVEGYDLDGLHPYRGLDVKRVFLARRDIPVWRGSRPVILIFSADEYDRGACRHAPVDSALGVLRPVQRYVLRAGLQRAREIYEKVLAELSDPWGFARVRKGDAPKLVTVTPPILEQLHEVDWEDEHGAREYILCDGTHRVVELVWNSSLVLPSVAILGSPSQPYYAKPFSRFEWEYTAENQKEKAPDQASKYAVRKVDIRQLTTVAESIIKKRSEADWYRRYYRDLSTGFGYMGGQGGRYV